MKSLIKKKRYDMIDTFNSTFRYLDDLLNIDNIHFEKMVHRIYPAELHLNKANASNTEAAFIDLGFGIKSGICLLIAPVPVHCFSLTFKGIYS